MIRAYLLTFELAGYNSINMMLAPYLLKSFAISKNRKRNIEIGHYCIDDSEDIILSAILSSKSDIVGFSCYVWNLEKVCSIIPKLKNLNPNLKIILGGPEVSSDSKKYLEVIPGCDVIVRGEGEETFSELLEALESGDSLQSIKGITYRESHKIFETDDRLLIKNLDIIPSPILTGILDLNKLSQLPAFETLRGCVYRCAYCNWHNSQKIRYFSLKRVMAELKVILDSNIDRVWFSDPIANINAKRFNLILKFIAENNFKNIAFDFEMKAELLTDETIKLLSKLKRGYMAFGLQSTNKKTLTFAKRKTNIEVFSSKFRLLRKQVRYLDLHIDLIYGLPYDNWENIKESVSYALSLFPDLVKLHPFKLLRGTEFYKLNNIGKLPKSNLDFFDYKRCSELRESIFSLFHPSFRLPIYILSQLSKKSPFFHFKKMEEFFMKRFNKKLYNLISEEKSLNEHCEDLLALKDFLNQELYNHKNIIDPLYELCFFRYFVSLTYGGVLSLRQQKVSLKETDFKIFAWAFNFDIIGGRELHRFVTLEELIELPKRRNFILFNFKHKTIFEVPEPVGKELCLN